MRQVSLWRSILSTLAWTMSRRVHIPGCLQAIQKFTGHCCIRLRILHKDSNSFEKCSNLATLNVFHNEYRLSMICSTGPSLSKSDGSVLIAIDGTNGSAVIDSDFHWMVRVHPLPPLACCALYAFLPRSATRKSVSYWYVLCKFSHFRFTMSPAWISCLLPAENLVIGDSSRNLKKAEDFLQVRSYGFAFMTSVIPIGLLSTCMSIWRS